MNRWNGDNSILFFFLFSNAVQTCVQESKHTSKYPDTSKMTTKTRKITTQTKPKTTAKTGQVGEGKEREVGEGPAAHQQPFRTRHDYFLRPRRDR